MKPGNLIYTDQLRPLFSIGPDAGPYLQNVMLLRKVFMRFRSFYTQDLKVLLLPDKGSEMSCDITISHPVLDDEMQSIGSTGVEYG